MASGITRASSIIEQCFPRPMEPSKIWDFQSCSFFIVALANRDHPHNNTTYQHLDRSLAMSTCGDSKRKCFQPYILLSVLSIQSNLSLCSHCQGFFIELIGFAVLRKLFCILHISVGLFKTPELRFAIAKDQCMPLPIVVMLVPRLR